MLSRGGHARAGKWSESIAVGGKAFLEEIRKRLGAKAIGGEVVEDGVGYQLHESCSPYGHHFDRKMGALRHENSRLWRVNNDDSI